MIGLDEVGEFMNDTVVYGKHWSFDQSPVEVDIIIRGAGSPAIAIVNDLDFGNLNTETPSMMLQPWNNFLLGFADIPDSTRSISGVIPSSLEIARDSSSKPSRWLLR